MPRALPTSPRFSDSPRPKIPWNGYDLLPSQDLPDWYRAETSSRYDKRVLRFVGCADGSRRTVFVDATEWGELLVLAGAPYLQGLVDDPGEGDGPERCGQAITYGFVQEFHDQPVDDPRQPVDVEKLGLGMYHDVADAWQRIWTYRRLRASRSEPSPGDLSLQNWGYSIERDEGGNDYPFGYLFLSQADATKECDDWQGGIDLDVLAAAEARALGWHQWFKDNAPPEIGPARITLDRGTLGTGHGLSKLPYIRDTRRSVGLDGFLLPFDDLTGPASQVIATVFLDRIAIGCYPADIHALVDCQYSRKHTESHDTLPFTIPFRALTNEGYGNLLVAGKTMAQTFLANSATRLHPIEWSTGTAAGVAAAEMARTGRTSRQIYEAIDELQPLVAELTPIDWTVED